MSRAQINSTVAKSRKLAAIAFTLLMVGNQSAVRADEWAENAETCARLGSLVTAADIEKAIGRKPVVVPAAVATYFGGCELEIEIPGAQKLAGGKAGIGLRLNQHGSPEHALKSILSRLAFKDKDKVKEIAQDPRGLAVRSEDKYHFAVIGVDATALTLTLRDTSLNGPKVNATLGELIFKRALVSDAVSQITAAVEDVGIYATFRPMFAMMERCKQSDIPTHAALLKALEISPMKTGAVPAVTTMSPYAQRWFVANGQGQIVKDQLKRIADAPQSLLVGECEKLTASLPELEKNLPDNVLKALAKAAK
jgi:hypothetical protein